MIESIDKKALSELTESIGPGATSRIIQVFLDELDTLSVSLRENFGTNNNTEIASIAHTLKSTSATFGACAITDVVKKIERAALGQSNNSLAELIDTLEGVIKNTKPLYKSYTE